MMLILFAFYVAVVSLLGAGLSFVEKKLALPGFGR
jgi:polar amino acid transport system permease protein